MSCATELSFIPQQTMGSPRTTLAPVPEHSPTRCVRRILATAPTWSKSRFGNAYSARQRSFHRVEEGIV